jgi:hypothetical protein
MTDDPSREQQTSFLDYQEEVDEFLAIPLNPPLPGEYESDSRREERKLRGNLSPEEYRVAATAVLKHYYDLISTGKFIKVQSVTMGFNPKRPLSSGVRTLTKIVTAMEASEE